MERVVYGTLMFVVRIGLGALILTLATLTMSQTWAATLFVSDGLEMSSTVKESNPNENCIRTADVCVEAGGTRLINGVAVTRDCWAWRETYACLTPVDESLESAEAFNGCVTLENDRDAQGPGKCEIKSEACQDSVTDIEGNAVCLTQTQDWSCKEVIDLPAINATWTGHEEEHRETIDESACAILNADTTCSKGELVCNDTGCERNYACGGKNVAGCTALESAGCTFVKDLHCSEGGTSCAIYEGQMKCQGKLPDGIVESGGAELDHQETVNVGNPTPDASACVAFADQGLECTQVSQKCVDRYPTKRVINGKTYVMSCWGYERVMSCTRKDPISSCTGLKASPGCTVKDRICEEKDSEDHCTKERVTYQCGSVNDVDAKDAVLVESSNSLTETVEVNTCKEYDDNETCRLQEKVCVDDSGEGATCEHYKLTYVCGGGSGEVETLDDCKIYAENPECKKVDEVCLGTDADGNCTMTTVTYECGGGQGDVTVGEICDSQLCIAGVCEGSAGETSQDFLEGLALMEIARQAGVYGEVGKDALFGGLASACTTKMAGFSCCRNDVAATQGSLSNSAFGVALIAGFDAGVELIKAWGSPYVYDLLAGSEMTQGLLTALYGEAGNGVYSAHFSYYGVSASFTSGGSLTLEFSPMGFMAQVAMEMAAEYFSCTQEDQVHALRTSRGLCHYVGSYCDKTSALGCLEKKESWVCFNSKLAKTVQEQGRKQLGIGWGSPQSPITRGFTLKEFQSLDFSRMDLTGVITEIAQEAAKNGLTLNTDSVIERSQKRVESAAQSQDQYVEVDTVTGKAFTGETVVSPGLRFMVEGTLRPLIKGNSSFGNPSHSLLFNDQKN